MTDFVSLVAVEIEAQDPHVEDKNSNSSPSRKVPRKLTVILNIKFLIENYKDKNAKHNKTSSHSKAHTEKLRR